MEFNENDINLVRIENMDPIIEKFIPKKPYINKSKLAPQWPFRLLVVGASSKGKTNVIVNMIINMLHVDKLYLYFKDPTEDKYKFLISYFETIQEQYDKENDSDEKIIEWSNDPKDVISFEDLDERKQNLIIVDDFVVDRHQENLERLFILGRKRNASLIYQTQSLKNTPLTIRQNCDYIILFKANKGDLTTLVKTYANDIDNEEFKALYREAISEPFGWLLIDTRTTQLPLKYRLKFDGLYYPKPQDKLQEFNKNDYLKRYKDEIKAKKN